MSITKLPTGKFQVRWQEEGKNRKKSFPTMRLASLFESKKELDTAEEGIFGKNINDEVTIETLIKEHREQKQKKENSKLRDDFSLSKILEYLNKIGIKYLSDLTKQHIRSYETERLKTATQRTANIDIITLQAVLNFAVDNDRILYSPIKNFKKTKITKKEKRFLYPDEIELILDNCPSSEDRDMIYMILTMGLRISEVLNFQKSDYKNGIAHIRIKETWSPKWDKERKISIDADYCNDKKIPKIFKRPKKQSGLIFTNESEDLLNRSTIRNRFDRIVVKAGINKPKEITLHTLRHTHISYAVARGINLRTIMENVGISSYEVLLGYSHTVKGLDKNIPDKSKFPWQ